MHIQFHNNFKKDLKLQNNKIQEKLKERLVIFMEDPYEITLNNHPLHGKYKGYRSINISGDIRAIYKLMEDKLCVFVAIGTHSKLYK